MAALVLLTLFAWRVLSQNLQETPSQRAQALVAQMSEDEKIAMVHGAHSNLYAGSTPANTRLGIPELHLEDGPQGVGDGNQNVTNWPSALTVVATWDIDAMLQFSIGMGKEQRIKGTNVMLGPMVNIARVVFGGRNYESFGEEPFLSATMAHHSIRGIQSQGVIATVKHFADNNQEEGRQYVSANVDERTQYEIYYPAFEAAVRAGVGSVMCAYNRINGTYSCSNEHAITKDLKGTMGYQGWIMSDWTADHSTVPAANAGLDQEMPGGLFFNDALKQAIANGSVSMDRLNDMTTRILTSMFAVGLFDNPQTGNLSNPSTSEAHNLLARRLAATATVLLKNEGSILPLADNLKTLALIGDGAENPVIAGTGSGHVNPPYVISPMQGIKTRAPNTQITYAPTNATNIAAVAAAADVAIVFVSAISGEGNDRTTLSLGTDQDNLVSTVTAAQKNTVVVINAPGGVLMPWLNTVRGIVMAWFPGQECGNALAEVLFGDINPSARLPVTFPPSDTQIPTPTRAQYPGIEGEVSYSEKLEVGYRWYDANNVAPLFPFGHGLSYTTFQYSNLAIYQTSLQISVDVRNNGSLPGAEVVQLYLGFPKDAGEPPQVLRGFQKVHIGVGQTETVLFSLSARDFSIWNVVTHAWMPFNGTYQVHVGASSRDIRQSGVLKFST